MQSTLSPRRLGPFTVSSVGLGCMNLSHGYGAAPPADEAAKVLLRALDLGVTHFDTAALYGYGANEELVGRTLAAHRNAFTLASKCGIQGVKSATGTRRAIDGRPETLRKTCEDSLRRLKTDVIDLYYLHRWDKSVAIEESVGALSGLVREGKIRAIGLSEVSAATLRRAHAVHPIAAVQSEYSLCTRNPEIAVIETCRSIGATFVAFSPLARGFLAGSLPDVALLAPADIRRTMPRFDPAPHSLNLHLLDEYARLARAAHASMAQLALAWVLARGAHVVAIPGTTCTTHLEENLGAATIELQPDLLSRLDALINQRTVAGERYNAAIQAEVDTENF
jgi:aryl-alcohol dehydrogenase-like predicted oxidoreductase